MAGGGPILYGDPVEWGHPLNRGLAACYRPLPGRGGGCLPDLTGRPPATFVGGPALSAGRPGDTAAVLFDGSDDEAVGTVPTGMTVANATVFVWAKFSGASLKGCLLKVGGTSSGYGIGIGNSAFETPGLTILGLMEASRWLNSGTNVADGWQSLGLTIGPTGAGNLWLNGQSIYSFSASGSDVSPTGSVYVGGYGAGGAENRHFPGPIGEARVYTRTLTASEMAGLHWQVTAGGPDLYRRVRSASRGFTPAGGGGVTGDAASTQAANTGAGAGTVLVSGSASSTQAAQTGTSAGAVAVAGAGSATQAANAGTAAGTVLVTGAAASTQGSQTGTAAGTVAVAGAASQTQAAQTGAGAGTVLVTGAAPQTQAADTGSAAGLVVNGPVGDGAATQAAQTGAAAGAVLVTGAGTVTQAAQTGTAAGTVAGGSPITGAGAVTQAAHVGSGSGFLGDEPPAGRRDVFRSRVFGSPVFGGPAA